MTPVGRMRVIRLKSQRGNSTFNTIGRIPAERLSANMLIGLLVSTHATRLFRLSGYIRFFYTSCHIVNVLSATTGTACG